MPDNDNFKSVSEIIEEKMAEMQQRADEAQQEANNAQSAVNAYNETKSSN